MKYLLSAVFAMITLAATAQHKLEKIWETAANVAVPESVLPEQNILYVSLIDGGGWDADGKGGVGKLSLNGKDYDSTWATGLNAPKGLGKFENQLYAADINEVAVINVNTGKVEKKIAIPGGQMLNDITVSDKGVVYVSDSKTGKIWKIENGQPSVFLENINGANGLKAIGNDLIFAEGKLLKKADANKNITQIAEVTEGIDGIEPVGNGDFLVTSWVGYIYYVHADGHFETLLETHDQKINAADIGYNPQKKILYVPTFLAKKVVAYQLQ
jgi:sugar lactone lactonase YvrE